MCNTHTHFLKSKYQKLDRRMNKSKTVKTNKQTISVSLSSKALIIYSYIANQP